MPLTKSFISEFDGIADKCCEAMKTQARSWVEQGMIKNVNDIHDLIEVKAAICAAMRLEIHQWRFRNEITPTEKDLYQCR